jgi:hypothetical protein
VGFTSSSFDAGDPSQGFLEKRGVNDSGALYQVPPHYVQLRKTI